MKLIKSKKTLAEKQQLLAQKCKNKSVTEQFIAQYQKCTKGAIEQILNMGESVLEVYRLSKSGALNQYDLNYFCMNVGINQKSSTFRKYKAIGENADKFRECIEKLPSAFSVLYEIATLGADLFEKIVINGQYGKNLTLKQVRQLASKSDDSVPSKNKSTLNVPSYASPRAIAKVIKEINKITIRVSRNLNEGEFNSMIQLFDDLQKKHLIEFDLPQITDYLNDSDDVDRLKLAA